MQPFIGILCGVFLVGFIVFAFRQGMKVTPDDRRDSSGQTNYGGGGGDA
jgi:hypothetical protein